MTLLSLGLVVPVGAGLRVPLPVPVLDHGTFPSQERLHHSGLAPMQERGQMLYENHCLACHESAVHIRSQQQVRSQAQLRERVLHWAGYLQLRWGSEDVEDVVRHLEGRYYQFERR